MYTSSFVRALLDRGHEVTYLTSISMNQPNLVNYTEVLIDPPQNMTALGNLSLCYYQLNQFKIIVHSFCNEIKFHSLNPLYE